MTFQVAANYVVKFLNPDDLTGSGMRVKRGRVEGSLEAVNRDDAVNQVRESIEARFPVRWSLEIGKVYARAV